MFLHYLKYEILSSLRVKDLIFWLILFPIILGTLFKIAFGHLYEKFDTFSAIPVAVVDEAPELDSEFALKLEIFPTRDIIDSVSEGDQPFLKVTYTDRKQADELLKKGKVTGIISMEGKLSLTVHDSGIEETLLQNFVDRFNSSITVVTEAITSNPNAEAEIIQAISTEIKAVTDIPLTKGNTDYYTEYFYNLIAMVAMYGSLTGLNITIRNQGNLSKLGARKCCSPAPKSISLLASLIGSFAVQSICMLICVSFLRFVLRIDFGSRLPAVYLAAVCGGILGVSFGFCIGSIGALKTEIKTSICFAVSMFFCFCSGLMIGNMKIIIEEKAPWFNKINPAAVITDSLYYLNVDKDYSRFQIKMITIAVLSAAMILLGFGLTRRKKYASL